MVLRNRIITTRDGQKIALDHYNKGRDKVIVLAHGFFNNKDAYLFKKIAEELSEHYDVVSFDFRGHGKSSGFFTWTAREHYDLAAVIDYAKENNYKKIGVAGFSLGAAITLIEASRNKQIDSIIAVSPPFDFWQINFHFWEPGMLEDLKLNLGMKGKNKFVRPGNIMARKIRPIDIIGSISPVPVYFIHGADDWIIKPGHSKRLFEKCGDPKKILIIESGGHAEKMFDEDPEKFISECKKWFDNTMVI